MDIEVALKDGGRVVLNCPPGLKLEKIRGLDAVAVRVDGVPCGFKATDDGLVIAKAEADLCGK